MKMHFALWSFLFLLFSCGKKKGYEELVPGLEMKKWETGTDRMMQSGTDYFYLRAHVMDEDDTPIADKGFNPSFFFMTQIKEPAYTYDFTQGLPGLRSGDSVSFRTRPDSLFPFYYGMEAPAALPEFIHLHVKVLDILSEADYVEKLEKTQTENRIKALNEFEEYLTRNGINQAPIGTGTIKVTQREGSGPDAFYGDWVTIHMVQKLMNGTQVENTRENGAVDYEIGGPYGMKGMDEALMKMKKGERAVVYLPYFLAFGEAGAPPKVPPYTNLIMELEILEIRKPQ
jgi:FKBP-type peptidyl-prolyl cis-trans isomerase